MTSAKLTIGDSLTVLRTMPDDSVDLVLTSPPYLALRSYLPADHPDKHLEVGSEPTPGEFIDTLLDVTEELARVLAPHGSICVELSDTFSGSGGAGGDYAEKGLRDGQPKFSGSASRSHGTDPMRSHSDELFHAKSNGRWRSADGKGGRGGWPADKSLSMIPESYRWALAYGRNPFNGRETDPWRVRNVVRHFRPNPPVGSLGDKVRPATSEWVVACKSGKRFFDLDSVRNGPTDRTGERSMQSPRDFANHENGNRGKPTGAPQSPNGAPPLDWWDDDDLEWKDAAGFVQPTGGYKGTHYAVFSPRVVARLIKPMCPEKVCRTCGEPSRRITEKCVLVDGQPVDDPSLYGTRFGGERIDDGSSRTVTHKAGKSHTGIDNSRVTAGSNTLGWTDCGHDDYRAGVVLDPFTGSGTTLQVATGHGFDAIGIDLDSRNVDLCRERVGMFLEVVEPTKVAA